MKIGILTFSSAYNFGAVMQCYALFETIRALGHDVEIINYVPKYLASRRPKMEIRTFVNRSPWRSLNRIRSIKEAQINFDGYKTFEDTFIEQSVLCRDKEDLSAVCSNYDFVIVGSDQVWNKRYNGNDEAWYGLNGDVHNVKWITYAASAGDPNFSEKELNELKVRLQNFKALSLRESKLEEIVKRLVPPTIRVKTVLDPSLLANPIVWEKWTPRIVDEPYILTYQARESQAVFDTAEHISSQIGVEKIIPIDRYNSVVRNGYPMPHYCPSEFISLVKNAECMITTSFHGSAFSIIFNTPFYTLRLNDGADERSENLLSQTGLLNRFIDAGVMPNFSKPDFSCANKILQQLRIESLEFLKNNLV